MVRRTSGKPVYIKRHVGSALSLAAIIPCITASSPSEAVVKIIKPLHHCKIPAPLGIEPNTIKYLRPTVVGQHSMHDGLCSTHTEAVIVTQSEVIYSA